jgi:hypothetical protein
MEPRNRFQSINSASLCSLAGRYDNPIPTRCLAPKDFLKIPSQVSLEIFFGSKRNGFCFPSPFRTKTKMSDTPCDATVKRPKFPFFWKKVFLFNVPWQLALKSFGGMPMFGIYVIIEFILQYITVTMHGP